MLAQLADLCRKRDGFPAAARDCSINYDIKYRMGRDAAAGDDE